MEGQVLGNRYELIERIGGGGMAVVYKARCRLLNRYVAVKILRSEFIDDEEFVNRFRVEAQAAASLSHPNIVSIFDVGHDGDIHYIVMEYIDGITLKEYIDQSGPLHWKEAVNIAIQICSAIEQAHKNHIVHRDIKPHNILITREGIAKVTDFGIARAVSSATITMVGSTIGSVHYFSPEQARGGFIDEKSDLYSLGITLYEMITGRVPFDGESPVAVALKHIQEKAERPADINPSIPKGVNDLVVKAMKKDQNLRYQNASDMLSDLQRTLGEPNVKIPGSGTAEKLPTRKMQAVGSAIDVVYEEDDLDEEGNAESDDTMAKKRKKDRMSVWLGIATGLVIASILFFIGMKIILPAIMPENSEDYVVQDFTNKDFNDVKEELDKYGIIAEDNEHVFSDTFGQNMIISQDVAIGNTLKPGNRIKFEVSDGPEVVEIPDVNGKELRVGEQEITDKNLEYEVIQEQSETVGTGLIIRTEPAALEKVKPDTTIYVYESLGPELKKVTVPNIVGLTRAEAEKLLADNNLKIGKMIPSDVISDVAKIIKQYPLAGTEADEETGVEMTFDITESSQGGTGQGTTGNTTTGGNNDNTAGTSDSTNSTDNLGTSDSTGITNEPRTELIKVTLEANRTYGDEILVYVETTYSDTNKTYIEFNQSIAKKNFPFSIPVTLSETGKTHIIVKLDGILVQEGDL